MTSGRAMTSTQPAGWHNPRIVITLLVVFLCGASAGMLIMATGLHRLIHPTPTITPGSKDGKEVSLQRLKKELDLTPQQTEQLETILDDFFTYYHTLQAQLDDVRSSGKQKILRILDENQKKKFEKLMAEMQDKQQLR